MSKGPRWSEWVLEQAQVRTEAIKTAPRRLRRRLRRGLRAVFRINALTREEKQDE